MRDHSKDFEASGRGIHPPLLVVDVATPAPTGLFTPSEAIKYLNAYALAEAHRRYPNIPEHLLGFRKYTDKTANGLTRCIIDLLRLNGWQAERINCMGRMIDNRVTTTDVLGHVRVIGSTKYVPTTGTKGTADISATIRGRSVKIEVKIGADRQSEAQRDYEAAVTRAGGVYMIARTLAQFAEWYMNFIR